MSISVTAISTAVEFNLGTSMKEGKRGREAVRKETEREGRKGKTTANLIWTVWSGQCLCRKTTLELSLEEWFSEARHTEG